MCHSILQDPKLYSFLLTIDHDLAAATRQAGCACGGALHKADYPRKPRGAPIVLSEAYAQRQSFCCAVCRRRHTPASVRFLGRRVYFGVTVILLSALCAGVTDPRARELAAALSVPRRTLERWRHWWLTSFVESAFWCSQKARFMPPIDSALLPKTLLDRFVGESLRTRLLALLQFLRPLTTRLSIALPEAR